MDNKTTHLEEEVEDGNPSVHQGWEHCSSTEHRGIGVHVTTTLRLGSIAIECIMKEVGVMRCPCLM